MVLDSKQPGGTDVVGGCIWGVKDTRGGGRARRRILTDRPKWIEKEREASSLMCGEPGRILRIKTPGLGGGSSGRKREDERVKGITQSSPGEGTQGIRRSPADQLGMREHQKKNYDSPPLRGGRKSSRIYVYVGMQTIKFLTLVRGKRGGVVQPFSAAIKRAEIG